MCIGHPKEPVIPGKTTCGICVDNYKRYRSDLKSSGKCSVHPRSAAIPGKTKCQVCFEQRRSREKTYQKRRLDTDVNYRLKRNLRSRLYQALTAVRAGKKVSAVKDLGCSVPELIKHLEARFKLGMTWDNYGQWHVDHIRPLASFNLTDAEQQKAACHYNNLQPLWAAENISKGSRC